MIVTTVPASTSTSIIPTTSTIAETPRVPVPGSAFPRAGPGAFFTRRGPEIDRDNPMLFETEGRRVQVNYRVHKGVYDQVATEIVSRWWSWIRVSLS